MHAAISLRSAAVADCNPASLTPSPLAARNVRRIATSSCDMHQLQRKIDGGRRMGDRAHGNVIAPVGRDLPDVFQAHPATGFEFYLALAEGDCFPHLSRAHVVEQNYFDPVQGQKNTNLI